MKIVPKRRKRSS